MGRPVYSDFLFLCRTSIEDAMSVRSTTLKVDVRGNLTSRVVALLLAHAAGTGGPRGDRVQVRTSSRDQGRGHGSWVQHRGGTAWVDEKLRWHGSVRSQSETPTCRAVSSRLKQAHAFSFGGDLCVFAQTLECLFFCIVARFPRPAASWSVAYFVSLFCRRPSPLKRKSSPRS